MRNAVLTCDEASYKIDLGLAGYEDGSRAIPLRTRIDTFHKHQRAWNSLAWTAESTVTSDGLLITDTVWIQYEMEGEDDHDRLTFTRIGSQLRGVEEQHWSYDLSLPSLRDSDADQNQDLLIVVRYPLVLNERL